MAESIGPMLRRRWRSLARLPGGKWLFSRVLGVMVPYSATLHAGVLALEPGYCRVVLRERRRVRNHLHSVHAMALANLAELATGLALNGGLPDRARAILTGFNIEYLRKARGTLTAECRCVPPADNSEHDCEVSGEIRDAAGEVVATARALWRTGPAA
jgi:uncharacterized protein (TIGR00369 family)